MNSPQRELTLGAASTAVAPLESAPANSASGEAENATKLAELEEALDRLQGSERGIASSVCQQSHALVKRLLEEVRLPEGNRRLGEASLTLYHTGASCAARAGDCRLAWQIFSEGFPRESLVNLREESQRMTYMKMAFGSMIPRCKGQAP
ncbi:MAG: hypothetical protein RMJ98_23000 [Myxococcales bacterium]|nr:hypothetical protein [Polyangiaceae bacterium]MDW8252175.1 hypothetical protein [Myxococcales bacterium]